MSLSPSQEDHAQHITARPEYEYAYFFPEGTGYLWVKRLGDGVEGKTDIVWSCDAKLREDRIHSCLTREGVNNMPEGLVEKYFVRKKTKPVQIPEVDPSFRRHQANLPEIVNFRNHPRIPKLEHWNEYHPFPRTDARHDRCLSAAMIFQYCNAGTLNDLREAYRTYRQEHHRLNINTPNFQEVYIPEAFIWKVFGQVVETVDWLRHQRPGINHGDIHSGNIFLHFSQPDQTLPDCFLGDFGLSTILYSESWDHDGLPAFTTAENGALDLRSILDLIKELMTLEFGEDVDDPYNDMSDVHEYYSDLLYFKVQWLEDAVNILQEVPQNPSLSALGRHMTLYGESQHGLQPVSLRGLERPPLNGPTTYPLLAMILNVDVDAHPPGPWKIARIRSDTKEVVALSREVYQTYQPVSDDVNLVIGTRHDGDHSLPGSARDISVTRL